MISPPYRILTAVLLAMALASPAAAGALTLTGEGQVQYLPDAVHFELGTQTRADSAAAARAAAGERIDAWHEAIGGLRQELEEYDDSQIRITEVVDYDDQGRPTDKRFFLASQTVRFNLKNLELLNQVIAAAEKANLSYQLNENSYYASRSAELENAALAAAIDDAKARCVFVADRLQRRCGKVETLRVLDQGRQPRPMMMDMNRSKESVSRVGEREISASVEATFALD